MFLFCWNFWHWWGCAWFYHCRVCSRFNYTLLLFSSDLWDELVCFPMQLCRQLCAERLYCWWKGCWLKLTRCCPLLFRILRAKLQIQLSLPCCLIFFPTLAFQCPVKNTSDLFLSSLRTALASLTSSTQTSSLTSWLVGVYTLMMLVICLGFGMKSRLMVIFGIGGHLYDSPFRWTFKLSLFLNSEDDSLMLYARFSVLDNLICRTLTLSNTYQCLWILFFNCRETLRPLP